MDVEPEPLGEQRVGTMRPYATDDDVSAPRSSPGSSRSGWSTGMPRRSATSFAGGAGPLRPRPAGASGRVRRHAISCRDASRSRTSAPNGAVAATAIRAVNAPRTGCGRQPRERPAARLVVGAVDDEHAVQVVELVLHDPCGRQLQLELDALPVLVEPLDGHGGRALDRHEHLPQREAALVLDVRLLRALRDHGVHEHAVLALVHEDEQPAQDADLGRREPDALRLVHEARHALDEAPEVVVDVLDLARLHAQRGVAVLPDPRERDQAPRLALELQLVALALLVIVLVLVLVRARDRGRAPRDRGRDRDRGRASRGRV